MTSFANAARIYKIREPQKQQNREKAQNRHRRLPKDHQNTTTATTKKNYRKATTKLKYEIREILRNLQIR